MDELKPTKAILLVTPDMEIQSQRLEKVLKQWGFSVVKKPIAPYNLNSARETCLNLIAENEKEDIILNATGGTKIMAFAAFEVFREMGKTIIYVDTQDRVVQVLSPESKNLDFKSLIKVQTYLSSYGQNIIRDKKDLDKIKRHKPVIESIVKNINQYEFGISILNKHTAPYRNIRTFPFEIEIEEQHKNTEFYDVLTIFHENKDLYLEDNKIIFSSIEDVEFASGGWLEEYVFEVVSSLSPTDLKMGVEVEWDQKGTKPPKNEYDVVFTNNNQLYLIECKTKRFEGFDRIAVNEDPIYKLESLKDSAGGLYGKGMLVSYKNLTDIQKKRLKANRLEYCDGSDLKRLREIIKKWMQ